MTISDHPTLSAYYDLIKNVYVYSHMKPFLKDPERQKLEYFFIITVSVILIILILCVAFKILVLFIYFLLIQTTLNFVRFICAVSKNKCNIFFWKKVKSACNRLSKIFKKLYTYNFYAFDRYYIGGLYIACYLLYLYVNFYFMLIIRAEIEEERKSDTFILIHFLTFQVNILIELICVSFYNIRSMVKQFIVGLAFYGLFNGIVLIVFAYQQLFINIYGTYDYDEPRRFANLILNAFMLIVNINSLRKLKNYDANSKNIIFITFPLNRASIFSNYYRKI